MFRCHCFCNFPDSLLKPTSETILLKTKAFDLQESAFAEKRKCSWKSKGKVLKEAGDKIYALTIDWKGLEKTQPVCLWERKWGHWTRREKGSGSEAWPWERSRGSGSREQDVQDEGAESGVSAQSSLTSLHHHSWELPGAVPSQQTLCGLSSASNRSLWLKSYIIHSALHCLTKASTEGCLVCSAGVMPNHVLRLLRSPICTYPY